MREASLRYMREIVEDGEGEVADRFHVLKNLAEALV